MAFIVIAYSVALAFLFVLLLRSIAVQISPPPPPQNEPYPDTSTKELCEEAGGRWLENSQELQSERAESDSPQPASRPISKCQGPLKFERDMRIQQDDNQQTSLFVFLIGGTIAVAGSAFLRKSRVLSLGLMLGGIFSFFVAGTQLWMLAPGLGRVITIAILFLVLTGIGVYVFRDSDQEETAQVPQ